ncbi:MAG: division/cell wall cluster transcriptional repressor MraZ [Patescibacteria group bacterium]|nr:division/cell wall cluster transcriptional repressor MraZ [Patescibacteria group bacterium]
MIVGQYQIKIGAKKRVAFPKKFRDSMGNKLFITRGYEGCLVIVDQKRWNKITNQITQGTFLDRRVRDSSRFLLAGAHEIVLDEQGRFVIPDGLFQYAELELEKKEVVFLGLVNWVEIWSVEKWHEHEEYVRQNGEQIVQELAGLSSNN